MRAGPYKILSSLIVLGSAFFGAHACGTTPSSSAAAAAASSAGTSQTSESGRSDAAAQQSLQAADDAGSAAAPAAGLGSGTSQKSLMGRARADALAGWVAANGNALMSHPPAHEPPRALPGLSGQLGCLAATKFVNEGNEITLSSDFGKAACKRGKRSLSGNETLVFDANAHTLSVYGTVSVKMPAGTTVTTEALDPNLPLATMGRSGRPAEGKVTLSVQLNQHRVAKAADDSNRFIVDVQTPQGAVQVTDTFDANGLMLQPPLPSTRRVDGVVVVHHLLAGFVSTNAHQGIERDLSGTCACPSRGVMVQQVVYDADQTGYVRTTTFTGCGQATVKTTDSTHSAVPNGSTSVVWEGCD